MTSKDREILKLYTGWGGFKSTQKWSELIQRPEYEITENAILYEYYTPLSLTYSIAHIVNNIIDGKYSGLLPVSKWKGKYRAIEQVQG